MEVIKLPNHVVEIYNSIKELPMFLSKELQKNVLQDIGVGSTMKDVDEHIERLAMFVKEDRKSDIIEELKNMRFNFFSMLEKIDHKSFSFACLIKSINGNKITDYSSENLERIINQLSEDGLTYAIVEPILEDVKKNLMMNALPTFQPSLVTI